MYSHPQQRASHDMQKLRREAGKWLKSLRETQKLSQRELAQKVGVDYYTFISQLEVGRGRIPPDRYEAWSAALGLRAADFVKELMRYYDPVTYRLLFGEAGATAPAPEPVVAPKTATATVPAMPAPRPRFTVVSND
ncbi:MAG: family transcriptional regulator [Rhodospirillales bacterium]|nr:family transcriptional regulator [Rhodospirillales bacterium]